MKRFDEYVSLGAELGGCEIGFQLRRISGTESSHFFTWRSAEFGVLLEALRNRFRGVMSGRHLDPGTGCMKEEPFGILYHALETIEDDRDKALHMLDRFYAPTGPRCYLRKQYLDVARDDLVELRDLLLAIEPSSVIVLIRERGRTQGRMIEGVYERELPAFAHPGDTTAGDIDGWDRIFAEFPLHRSCPSMAIAAATSELGAVTTRVPAA